MKRIDGSIEPWKRNVLIINNKRPPVRGLLYRRNPKTKTINYDEIHTELNGEPCPSRNGVIAARKKNLRGNKENDSRVMNAWSFKNKMAAASKRRKNRDTKVHSARFAFFFFELLFPAKFETVLMLRLTTIKNRGGRSLGGGGERRKKIVKF